ncbi:family 16 glycosylhydrolase [Flavobacterium laiguense]|uniref:Laminarinase n=1 Tax=Flavobacterium laiguense TaxID=2169409 RepID=A0A2U1JVT7_9FLAO|nr:family 16 glycosylhydrolase [Flavobacterium laiguense]PWA09317.1 laminarinase [Flavobacterium laiguense]
MKKIVLNIITIFSLLLMVNCQEDNNSFGALDAPSNFAITVDVMGKTDQTPFGDGSGKVKFITTADNAVSFKYVYGDGIVDTAPGGVVEHAFTSVGVNTYTVTIIASGKGGVTSNTTVDVKVFSNFSDAKSTQLLTGGSATGKKWYLAANEAGHLGVGQNDGDATKNYYPNYYQAGPFEKSTTCFYDGDYTFALVGDKIEYTQDNKGNTFFHNSYKSVAGGTNGGDDACLPYSTAGKKTVALSPSTSVVSKNPEAAKQTVGTVINFSEGGFMGYYAGATQYEILSITENRMVVRFVQANNAGLAWYQTFTTTRPVNVPQDTTEYTTLDWADEFKVNGAPDPTKWKYDLGNGSTTPAGAGWGNGEKQDYTNLAKNVSVVDGDFLKITAIKEGSGYTSARIKTQGLKEFTYGTIEMRAKMPVGDGTWAAFWSLGTAPVTWPGNGEIDFMEWIGNRPFQTQGALHYPGNSGGSAKVGVSSLQDPSSFHTYKTIWSPKTIRFFIDGTLFYTFSNSDTSLPFHKDFYMILNLAMGGSLGGEIDPGFTSSSMLVDYIKVYK